jgi:hypothetical protein
MTNKIKNKLILLSEKLKEADTGKISAVIGFDGFVDEIVHVVDKRLDAQHFLRLESMAEYGERIRRSAGLSTNVEMVTVKQKLGGNGPILSNSLIKYGVNLSYIGALGRPDIHPVFKEMVTGCKVYSLSQPARTDAIEFHDGKIISSKLSSFLDLNWDSIIENVGLEWFVELINGAGLIGFENWTMVPFMSDIWRKILEEAVPLMKTRESKALLFIDLADPEKRSNEDIEEALRLISRFSEYFEVYFGLNKKESFEIAEALGMKERDGYKPGLKETAEFIFSRMDIACLMIHPVKEACAVTKEGFFHVDGPYCEKPVLTTGAGDNMNAGFLLGVALGFDTEEALLLGSATSGYYVRNAESPEINDMTHFLAAWANNEL